MEKWINSCLRVSTSSGIGWRVSTIAVLSTLTILLVSQATALDIQMTFNSSSSDAPSYDSDGSKLTSLMGSVESYLEDIFEASGTLEVEFYYYEFDGGTLAQHTNLDTSGGKPTECRIRFDTTRTWFFDETPFDNSEFNMTQTLIGDLTSSQRSAYFTGNLNNRTANGSDGGPECVRHMERGAARDGARLGLDEQRGLLRSVARQ